MKSVERKHRYNRFTKGLTLVELLVTISIIAILASIIMPQLSKAREAAYLVRAKLEFKSIAESLQCYANDNDGYPADTSRNIPPGLEVYLAPGIWPGAAWPGSVFDWDNWNDPDNPGEKIYQISVRFCPIGQPSECKFPKTDWAENFDINSSVYYCIQGNCRAHIARPINHPGYCVNC